MPADPALIGPPASPGEHPAGSSRLAEQREMLHVGRRCEEGPDDRAPLGEQRSLAEGDGVVFQRVQKIISR